MSSILPITLTGDNLGKRHKQLNSLVNEVYTDVYQDFEHIQHIPEKSAIDRLFKIDLACKRRDVDYIIKNLKDSDMLYVTRALKSRWLLEPKYQGIINPVYLEDNIYPYMVTTAVTKMKHWLYLHLKDEQRSKDFYEYYNEKDFELSMKFLVQSSSKFIVNEFRKILPKITPKHFKRLCEKSSEVAKIFFDLVASDETVKSQYLNNEKNFYNSLKCLLKSDTSLYLDITEKYFGIHQFSHLSSIATKFIMTFHKDRFWNKPELYAACILDLTTVAENLDVDESKNLVVKLARAAYLRRPFQYKKVEPLIKRLKPGERAAFKKKIFVEKDFGEKVEEWPYEPPSAPTLDDLGPDIFEDSQHEPYEYDRSRQKLTMRYCAGSYETPMMCDMISCKRFKTVLDKLFDEYRFVGFEKTFHELRKRIAAESSSQNRQFIMLVLISKTGGRAGFIATLMELLARHNNEPANLRATVIRSLVKRAFIWRLPEDTWKQLLEFGQGLGLDGSTPDADCVEGLHCVFIRSLLQNGTCNTAIFDAFIDKFSDLSDYSLTAEEKKCMSEALPKMMLSAAKEKVKIEDAVDLISKLIEVLKTHKIKVETYLDLIPTVGELAKKDFTACSSLLENLFETKIGRRALFCFTYQLIKTEASQINALKHDISVLNFEILYKSCLNGGKFDIFFRKISVYFNEQGGLAMQYKNKIKEKEPNKLIGRPLAILLENELESYLQKIDKDEKTESKVFAAIVRANAHMTRPSFDIDTFGWRKARVKMIANKVLVCPIIDINNNIEKLLGWKRTARLALVLSNRTQNVTDVFVRVTKLRPTIGIKMGIKILIEQGDSFDTKVWETIRPLIQGIDFSKDINQMFVQKVLKSIDSMPIKIKPEYNIIVFNALENVQKQRDASSLPYLCRIEHILPNVNEDFIENILSQFLEKHFMLDKVYDNRDDTLRNCLYLRILFTYIYLSNSEEVAERRFETYGKKVLNCMTEIFNTSDKNNIFFEYLDDIMLNFKNTKVFMNPEYVSCLYVMEKFVNWMKPVLPIEQFFDKYATVHLTMLYYKTIRQAAILTPQVFENKNRKYKKGVEIVGNLFGKYIAKEVKELMDKYFESVIFLYKETLVSYLDTYFNYIQSSDFISSIIRGMIEEGKDEVRLGMYVLKEKYYSIGEELSAELSKEFEEIKELKSKFFFFAENLA